MKIKGDFVKLIPEIQDRENKKMRVYIQIDNVEAKVDQNEIEKKLTDPEYGRVEFSTNDLLVKNQSQTN